MATATAVENLRRFTLLDDGCWEWTGSKYPNGYGRCYVGGGRRVGAHRASYEHFVGPIPEGLVINHLCENKACVRPDHLEAVTSRENTMYSDTPARRHAQKTHCAQGHPFDEINTFYSGSTSRRCRACHNAARSRAAARLRR